MLVAKLVEYSIVTRVIVQDDACDAVIIKVANNKLLNDPSGYICGDNIGEITDDTEIPYDPETDN